MADLMTPGPAQLRHSPLEHLHAAMRDAEVPGPRAVRVRELPFVSMVGIRLRPSTPEAARVADVLGVSLPTRCAQSTTFAGTTCLWQGPDEWLVVSAEPAGDLVRALTAAIGDAPGLVVDLSANRTTIELAGPSARAVLEKGCSIDLHPREFCPGQAVSTAVGEVPIVLWQTDEEPTYRLLPRSSFADHLARWLIASMREYAVADVS